MPYLALLRHGQSQWNLENRFTGWVDVDLTAAGEGQALRSGELLAASGVAFDKLFTSVQTRAIRTGNLALDAAKLAWLPGAGDGVVEADAGAGVAVLARGDRAGS
jgi:2,3-bisphosphoglycerate-dependent phosphoglycerate mutase